MDPKRDIVDTFCHASRAIGHNPTLGFPFPTMWGVVRTEKKFTHCAHTNPPHPKYNWWVQTSIALGLHIGLTLIKRVNLLEIN